MFLILVDCTNVLTNRTSVIYVTH